MTPQFDMFIALELGRAGKACFWLTSCLTNAYASGEFCCKLRTMFFVTTDTVCALCCVLQGKARVYCCSCRHDAAGVEVVGSVAGTAVLDVKHPGDAGTMPMQSSSNLFSARLAFLQPASQVPEADEPSCSAASSVTGSVSHQQAEATSVEGSPAFSLCCGCSCGNLYAEQMARWHRSRPHSSTSAFVSGSSSGGGVAADQQASGAPAPSPAGDADAEPASSGDITGSGLPLPLPDVGEDRMSHWDLR